MISFAGQPLIDDDPEILERAQQVLASSDLYDFARPHWPASLAPFGFPWQERPTVPRINRLVWPTGASRCAMGWFLTDDNGLNIIRPAAYSGSQLTAAPFIMNDGTNSITTNLYMLPPRPLCQSGTGLDLYLITLVDQRYFWSDFSLPIVLGDPVTWAELLATIAAPVSILVDSVPAAYGMPTGDWNLPNAEDMPRLLDVTAAAVGMRVVAALDGSVRVLGPLSAASLLAASQTGPLAAGGFLNLTAAHPADLGGITPAGVIVVDGAGAFLNVTLASLSLPAYAGATTCPGVPVLKTLLTDPGDASLAKQIAKDWYLWRLAPVDAAFSGVIPWQPTGLEDRIEWTHAGREISTRVQRPPWNVRTESAPATPQRSYVRLTGNPGSECKYVEGMLQIKTKVGACYVYIDGPIVQVLDLNGSTSGSGTSGS